MASDLLFSSETYPKPFAFTPEVAQVFDDMISRSVPAYDFVNSSLRAWVERFYRPGTNLYDVGCSTGTGLSAVASTLSAQKVSGNLIGVDPAHGMLEKARKKLQPHMEDHSICLRKENAQDTHFADSSFVILNYTLQFIAISDRRLVLKAVFRGLLDHGVLFLSEKLAACCAEFQEIITGEYEHFKECHGYSKTEIARKKEALENVLVPLTMEEQMTMLKETGFRNVEVIHRWNNFATFVAQK
jgi:tRNA (cmo5U34)-methyltransferase